MKKVVYSIGIPASGKSTHLKRFAEINGYVYICPDEIRLELTGDAADQSRNAEVWETSYSRMADALQSGKSVVFDATQARLGDRETFIQRAYQYGAEKVQAVQFNIPLEIAKERNRTRDRMVPEFVLDRMKQSLDTHPPTLHEGNTSISRIDEGGSIASIEKHGHIKTFGSEIEN